MTTQAVDAIASIRDAPTRSVPARHQGVSVIVTDAMAARIADTPHRGVPHRQIIVTDPEKGEVVVHWRIGSMLYRCAECGPMKRANCMHAFSSALLLADRLLGISPAGAETQPQTTEGENNHGK
jgi:hypothetical protein